MACLRSSEHGRAAPRGSAGTGSGGSPCSRRCVGHPRALRLAGAALDRAVAHGRRADAGSCESLTGENHALEQARRALCAIRVARARGAPARHGAPGRAPLRDRRASRASLATVVSYALENALFQWRRASTARGASEPARSDLDRAADAVVEELRRRLGLELRGAASSCELYAADTDWATGLAGRHAAGTDAGRVVDAAFSRYAREASRLRRRARARVTTRGPEAQRSVVVAVRRRRRRRRG